jgi:LuxR family maltose regulon positive regulatory protein
MTQRAAELSPAAFASFGALLRHLRRRARLTQRELAIAVGYSESQISRLEQGERLPDLAMLRAQFVPALDLANEPAWVARLLELAAATHTVPSNGPRPSPPDTTPAGDARAIFAPPLLATKLYRPRAHPDLVPRPRLLARLASALSVPLTLIAAPAGFGKTTLLAEWIEQTASPAAWLALDTGDNDPTTFLRYLVAALQTLSFQAGTTTLALLQAPEPLPPPALLTPLVNDLLFLPRDSVLVLDDYHVLTSVAVHAAVTFLLEHRPPALHIILTSREDPPLPLARLRGQRQLLELRAADLRFTSTEASAFLTEVMGVALSQPDMAALEQRTEGWVAGLQLAALALQDRADQDRFIAAFTGSNHYIADYLAAEVLDRLPAHLRTFVLQTAILERMCGPLCDAILGIGGHEPGAGDSLALGPRSPHSSASYSQIILDEMERRHLFLVPLDDIRGWYRYHHLFADMARAQLLLGASRDAVAELHRRASAWYEQQELITDALRHALAAGEYERAAAMVEQRIEVLVRSDIVSLAQWLALLPADLIRSRPRLCLAQAGISVMRHELEDAETWVHVVEHQDLPSALRDDLLSEAASIRVQIMFFCGDFPRTIAVAQHALASMPADNLRLRGEITHRLGAAHFLSGNLTTALPILGEARRLNETAGDIHNALVSAGNYAATLSNQGQLRDAVSYLQQAFKQFGEQDMHGLPNIAHFHHLLSSIFYEWNDLETAAWHVGQGIAQSERVGLLRHLIDCNIVQARIQYALGDPQRAQAILTRVAELVHRYNLPARYTSPLGVCQAILWLAQGNLDAACAWARDRGLNAADEPAYVRTEEYFILARVLLMQSNFEGAIGLLERLQRNAEANRQMYDAIHALALLAVAVHAARPSSDEALRLIERALTLAAPEGYIRTFVDVGSPMAALLRVAHRRGIVPDYTARLLAAFGNDEGGRTKDEVTSPPLPPSAFIPQSLVEPLSERELAVLRLVAVGYANQAIARELVIEVGTVKRHVHSLLGKLEVQNRTQAVARARELGLL